MSAADYQPVYVPAKLITLTASAAVSAGDALFVSGSNTVAKCTVEAATNWVGVAAETTAVNLRVPFWGRGIIHESVTEGVVTAGDQLMTSGMTGRQVKTMPAPAANAIADINRARAVIGIAINSAADAGTVRWMEM